MLMHVQFVHSSYINRRYGFEHLIVRYQWLGEPKETSPDILRAWTARAATQGFQATKPCSFGVETYAVGELKNQQYFSTSACVVTSKDKPLS